MEVLPWRMGNHAGLPWRRNAAELFAAVNVGDVRLDDRDKDYLHEFTTKAAVQAELK